MHPCELLWEFNSDGSVISVAATPNFSTICAATVGKSVYLIDGSGKPLWDKPCSVDEEAWATAISEDGQYIAVGTASKSPADGTLYVVTRDGRPFWSHRIGTPVWSVSLSNDGEMLAASTWGGNNFYLFRRQGSSYSLIKCGRIPGEQGLYGIDLARDGKGCVVASYDSGLFWLNATGETINSFVLEDGCYNVALAQGTNIVYAGTRAGAFLVANPHDTMTPSRSLRISQRPICGIATCDNGLLVACGSFDGRVLLSNDRGDVLWDYQTKGEIWTTAMSANGAIICAGGGDHKVRVFQNLCHATAYQEIQAVEHSVFTSCDPNLEALNVLVGLYLKYKLSSYGHSKLAQLAKNNCGSHVLKEAMGRFLTAAAASRSSNSNSHLQLAELLVEEKKYLEAIRRFQLAAEDPMLRSSAQRQAAECFTELHLNTAATSAWRQSREQHLDGNAQLVLFMLARSYEDCGEWQQAAKIYEMIISWDAHYRNSWEKLDLALKMQSGSPLNPEYVAKDYTGVTTSLLGPDAPRDVDESLKSILAGRSQEVSIELGDLKRVREVVRELLDDKVFSRGIRSDISQLDYDIQLFLKYDFGLPEDEMKKFLETVNALTHFRNQLGNPAPLQSLDIGSATGRYPSLLTRLGFQAHGIDIEERAIEYSRKKTGDAKWPKFTLGDARVLEKYFDRSIAFDVITCMMGTFEHIPIEDQDLLIKSILPRLKPGGVAIISVWDVECPHLSYLSIYDESQKELIRRNSKTRLEMKQLFEKSGFRNVETVPFCLLPQTIIYDLGIERMRAPDIDVAAQADLAVRGLFNDRHGEMFLTIGYKS